MTIPLPSPLAPPLQMAEFRRKLLLVLKSITRSEEMQGLQAKRVESLATDVDIVLQVRPCSAVFLLSLFFSSSVRSFRTRFSLSHP